jgi:hypothetical protein
MLQSLVWDCAAVTVARQVGGLTHLERSAGSTTRMIHDRNLFLLQSSPQCTAFSVPDVHFFIRTVLRTLSPCLNLCAPTGRACIGTRTLSSIKPSCKVNHHWISPRSKPRQARIHMNSPMSGCSSSPRERISIISTCNLRQKDARERSESPTPSDRCWKRCPPRNDTAKTPSLEAGFLLVLYILRRNAFSSLSSIHFPVSPLLMPDSSCSPPPCRIVLPVSSGPDVSVSFRYSTMGPHLSSFHCL